MAEIKLSEESENLYKDQVQVVDKKLAKNKRRKIVLNKYETKSDFEPSMAMEIEEMLRIMPLTDDTTCGFWYFKGSFLQRFANQNSYVVLYGLVGCIFSMTFAYFNGTLTTIEKRFKIPSRNLGIITVGYDISQLLIAGVLSYYAGKGHRPRWIGFGLLTIGCFSLFMMIPHFMYGAGEDALRLTIELGTSYDANVTNELIEAEETKTLCRMHKSGKCVEETGSLTPQIIFFLAQFVSGVGGSLYASLGVSYMDDNTEKSKTPALLSLAYFVRMLGPAVGYALASFCLRFYIAPHLTPLITNDDARWLGAWWLGWLFLAAILLFFSLFLSMFPKQLPRAAAKRLVQEARQAQNDSIVAEVSAETKASFDDMLKTFKELATNKTFMCNNWSSVFYFLGYTPYWIFTPKYIEIQYLQTAATSNLVTGSVALAFSAAGVLLSGFVISRYKPTARYMAAWNVLVGLLTIIGIVAYAFVGCTGNESTVVVNIYDGRNASTCNSACNCDYVPYTPVCGENNMTYISPCHAGCKRQHMNSNGQLHFYDCDCIKTGKVITNNVDQHVESFDINNLKLVNATGFAVSGACPVECFTQFVCFLAIMCCLKFLGAAGRASNFLITVRCVPEKDKVAAMGFDMMMMSSLAFIPGPIFFGWLLDRLCLVWGKTCTNKGNCWLYDAVALRYILNLTAALFITIGTIFDIGVWYCVKNLKIFDEENEENEMMEIRIKRKFSKDENL